MNKTMVFDIEVAFFPEITKMAIERGVDERKFSWNINANMHYITHISYKINKGKTVDLSVLSYGCFSKGEKQVPTDSLVNNELFLLYEFSKVYNQCDEVIAHYGKKFDIRFLNSRLAKHDLPPLKPMTLIDTWRILKDHFLMVNNRLDSAIKFFNCPYEKPALPWSVWRDVSLGKVKAHKVLQNRCRYDVLSLSWIYFNKLQAHASSGIINKALVYEKRKVDDKGINATLKVSRCPHCTRKGSFARRGYKYNKTSVVVQVQCGGCHGWATAPLNKGGSIGRIR